ncbi:GNAT family N-acetyltransferase [Massilia sp. MS-15]|uniref:GNAT family N-acetyltransferase n=1 Tax=Massilia sp. MS-15 TaxID=2878200 RepID=UPI001CD327CE|nr:GNAT family N-acetyltransferase [Massilia sp. MS-15]MCA1248607.1 GNAT family N-acetyltransferase [Massilia sp. MS-15]
MIVHRPDARAIRALRPQLAGLLREAVAEGYSLGFLAALDPAQAERYWNAVEQDVAAGSQKPNGSNRAELQKMLVGSGMRRRGIGSALLAAAEHEALALRRGLLFLDTEAGSDAEALYGKAGYIRVGELPDYACDPHGRWRPTAIWYKTLFPRGR